MGRFGGGEPGKAVVAGMISMEFGEGPGWFGHRRGREAEGRKGARARWSRATVCKGKGREGGPLRHSLKGAGGGE
jgi:hypothetical protein